MANEDTYPLISIQDLDDILKDTDPVKLESPFVKTSTDDDPSLMDKYRLPGTFADAGLIRKYLYTIFDLNSQYAGYGESGNVLQNFLSRLDRHGTTLTPLNAMNSGYTFITRPRLNLTSGNLRQHPIMSSLNSNEEQSIPFMIRALLDTRLCNGQPLFRGADKQYVNDNLEATEFSNKTVRSGLLDVMNPFLVPLVNGLKGISGFPDFTIQEETTEGDFHSGDFTFVKGGDMNNKTQELSLEFRDVSGSVILSIIYYWLIVMALQAKGVMMAYQDDIYEQRLNYTVSIYRFIMDTSRTQILWWAKATGCFPKSAPVGALFNINQGEVMISSAMNFSIPFVANDVKVNDPGALIDFNRLMYSYCNQIIDPNVYKPIQNTNAAFANFNALPFIVSNDNTCGNLMLEWRTSAYYEDVLPDNTKEELDEYQTELADSKEAAMAQLQGSPTNSASLNDEGFIPAPQTYTV